MVIVKDGIIYEEILGCMSVLGMAKDVSIKEVTIPETIHEKPVTKIAQDAFKNTSIAELWLPNTINTIGSHAFESCQSLVEVNIDSSGSNALYIENRAFKNCSSLVDFNAFDRTTTIGNYIFANCTNLSYLDAFIVNISAYAFQNCNNLHDIYLGRNAILLDSCLDGCPVEKLCTLGDATIHTEVLEYLSKINAKIYCTKDSNLLDLAYLGYHIELYPETEIENLLKSLLK